MTTTSYSVAGLHSAADMAALMERVAEMAGVIGVEVDLRRDAASKLAIKADGVLPSAEVGDWVTRAGVRVLVTSPSERTESTTDITRKRAGAASRRRTTRAARG